MGAKEGKELGVELFVLRHGFGEPRVVIVGGNLAVARSEAKGLIVFQEDLGVGPIDFVEEVDGSIENAVDFVRPEFHDVLIFVEFHFLFSSLRF